MVRTCGRVGEAARRSFRARCVVVAACAVVALLPPRHLFAQYLQTAALRARHASALQSQATVLVAAARHDTAGAPLAPVPLSGDSSHIGAHYALMAAGVIAAATGNQIIRSPKGWDNSWGGYARRLGDQVAFAVIEEGVRTAVDATVAWEPDTKPCAASARLLTRLVRRSACAIRQTALMRTGEGRARPNLPFATGVVLASTASVAWRPEGDDPVKARALVFTRIGVVFAASAATTLVTTWKNR